MRKKKNSAPTVVVSISTTPRIAELLDWLASTQLYGKNRADVAEELMRTKVREVLREHQLSGDKPPPLSTDEGTQK